MFNTRAPDGTTEMTRLRTWV